MNKLSRTLHKTVRRCMNLHEYQAAQIMSSYGMPMIEGAPARTAQEAERVAAQIGGGVVVKAQVHAGGRGRGRFRNSGLQSGVHILADSSLVAPIADKMLGDFLVTKQSGAAGKPVNTLYIVKRVDLKREIYLALTVDRERAAPLIIASPRGGMGIEEIDKKFILQEPAADLDSGFSEAQKQKIAAFLEPDNEQQCQQFVKLVGDLFRCFKESEATLVEINPLGVTQAGEMIVCDAKLRVDDNAKPRQKALFEMEDQSQLDPKEVQAEHFDLNYVKLSGNVGCLVNGAGLAMATMDLINFKGGKPANFLDVGGTATADRVKNAISIINEDEEVRSIFINIFGGIVRCDIIAEGAIRAVKELGNVKPIVMRVKGNNADIAKKMVEESGLKLYWFDDVDLACEKAISLR